MTGSKFEASLIEFFSAQRWYGGKSDGIASVSLVDRVPLEPQLSGETVADHFEVVIADVAGASGNITTYVLAACEDSGELRECSGEAAFWHTLLDNLQRHTNGIQSRSSSRMVLRRLGDNQTTIDASRVTIHSVEQSNTSVVIGGSCFLKLFRRPGTGVNPDVEICSFLSTQTSFRNSPRVAAVIELISDNPAQSRCLALISEFVRCTGDAWQYTLQKNEQYWKRVAERSPDCSAAPTTDWRATLQDDRSAVGESRTTVPPEAAPLGPESFAGFLDDARLLGQRTAELHVALASSSTDPAFVPEPLTNEIWQSLLMTIEQELQSTCELMERVGLPGIDATNHSGRLLERGRQKLAELRLWPPDNCGAMSIRCHGDYHLGQVLRTASDFVIIDFEGEPDRPLAERREKRCPLKDVAGMVRSLHYASNAAAAGLVSAPDSSIADPAQWQSYWYERCVTELLASYRTAIAPAKVVPAAANDFLVLLDAFLLEKVLYELRYELNNRPDWVTIPLRGLSSVLEL